MRAHGSKDTRRRAPQRAGERELALAPLFICLSLPGPVLCKLSQPGVVFVLPEVLTPVLGPSFVSFLRAFPFLVLSVQFSSVAQSCLTLCDPMNRSTPGHPVHHHLPEFTETHVHRVRDAIQPSHPLSSPSPPAPNPSQHQSLFQ